MCRSSGSSEFTSSLSFGEIRERLQCRSRAVVPDVVVSLISASDEEQIVRKRLTYSENGLEKTRTKNKLRARIHGVERFNPWTKTAAQIAREKQKRAKQSRKELEDDASTTLKEFNMKLDEMLEAESRDNVADKEQMDDLFIEIEASQGRKTKSKLQSIMKRKASKKKKKKKKENFEEMLYHINEDLRAPATPGDGKLRKRGRPRKYDSQGRSLSKPKLGLESAATDGTPIPRAAAAPLNCKDPFGIASDDPIWKVREDFFLPFMTLPRTKSQPPKKKKRVETERQDSDSSTSGDSVIAVGVRGGGNEFDARLKEELARPFSMAELEEKSESVNRQKPVVRSRDLRGERSVQFSTHKEGLSYLDHHPGFAKALRSAVSLEEELKLLRGFFFWIEHACMEGSFQPWVKQTFKFQEEKNHVIVLLD